MKRLSRSRGARLGQHFLMHPRIAERIAAAADIAKGETVLEVGPGRGVLTRALIDAGAAVVAIETDASLVRVLEERFAPEIRMGRLALIEADIRSYLAGPARELPLGYAVVANIPYYLTGELIRLLLARARQPGAMTLLLQKEVAERITAKEGKESLLSLSVKAYGRPRLLARVARGSFRPAPAVDSAILLVEDISRARFKDAAHEARFFTLIRAGFAHKRKYLAGNLAGLVSADVLRAAGVSKGARAEDLVLGDWLALSGVARLALARSRGRGS